MAERNGFSFNVEELGMVALATVVLVPGLVWAASARGTGGKLWRGGVVAGLLAGLMAVEITLDQTAEAVAEQL
jgi:hypothetical protein